MSCDGFRHRRHRKIRPEARLWPKASLSFPPSRSSVRTENEASDRTIGHRDVATSFARTGASKIAMVQHRILTTAEIDTLRRLERLPISWVQGRLLLMGGLGYTF